jgi:hypothetical protein
VCLVPGIMGSRMSLKGQSHSICVYRETAPPRWDLACPDAEERLRQYQQLESFSSATFRDLDGALREALQTVEEAYEFGRTPRPRERAEWH